MTRQRSNKQRTKLKPVDPFHPNNRRQKNAGQRRAGQPNADGDDATDQRIPRDKKTAEEFKKIERRVRDDADRLPRSVRAIKESMQGMPRVVSVQAKTKHRKSKSQSNAGFKRKAFESDYQFRERVARETHQFVQEQKLKIRYKVTGNPDTPEDALKADQLKRKQKKRKKNNAAVNGGGAGQKASTSQEGPVAASAKRSAPVVPTVDRQGRTLEFMLNAREIIPFGECANAPPDFRSILTKRSKKLSPSTAVIGRLQELNSTRVVSKNQERRDRHRLPNANYMPLGDSKERQSVIDQYRQQKRDRRKLNEIETKADEDVEMTT